MSAVDPLPVIYYFKVNSKDDYTKRKRCYSAPNIKRP
ncbi:hypothetical protein SAMN05421813_101286 [Daejeonella rubra]|uniref:Uncharacterized protein n=1 Tax=Daejeonella rubra TaxID=990371 RepID=A0A1G9M960_9SPHI|nr:hypothetical protein SAMN05421813_101286 [Daejeonella rubra]